MYKLTIYIHSNHVPFDATQKSYGFKSLVNFVTFQKYFKILKRSTEKSTKSNKWYTPQSKVKWLDTIRYITLGVWGIQFFCLCRDLDPNLIVPPTSMLGSGSQPNSSAFGASGCDQMFRNWDFPGLHIEKFMFKSYGE